MKRLLFLLIILSGSFFALAQLPIPELWGVRIHDEAKVLSPTFINDLEQQLKRYEDSTSNQIAILVVPSLKGEILEEYTLKVAESWKLGQAKNDNGILLFIAIEDRKARIEVGEGLEGSVPDAIANQIIRNELAPHFRQQDYEGGIQASINAIIKAIGGEYHADPQVAKRKGRGGSFSSILLIIIVIIILSRLFGGRNNRRGGGGWMSGPTWYGGGWSGRSSGGGWSGGGGFSGGGGGFSGGGSSGSW